MQLNQSLKMTGVKPEQLEGQFDGPSHGGVKKGDIDRDSITLPARTSEYFKY